MNHLEKILETKRREVAERLASADRAALEAAARRHPRRPFAPVLVREGLSVIAEMKRSSPSKGLLREHYDPAALARAYFKAGARAISVLTDQLFFGGSLEHLRLVRQTVPLPLLRKDFLIDPFQVLEAAAAGADAVLLIVAAFPPEHRDAALREMMKHVQGWGLDALVEVHNEEELDRALAAQATVVGVNNRDLTTLEVSVETSARLAPRLRRTISVAESGLRTSADLQRLHALGYHAFLIGEQLVTADDPGAALRELLQGVVLQEAQPA
jgi:indole-3-glycerol phosphate synthase